MYDRYLDAINREDELDRKRMERGSAMLADAINMARRGLDPRTPKDFIWSRPNGGEVPGTWGQAA